MNSALLESAARTATTNTEDQRSPKGRGVILILDVTEAPDVEESDLALTIEVIDPATDKYVPLIEFGDIPEGNELQEGNTTFTYTIYPGELENMAENSNTAQAVLPPRWRAVITHQDEESWTYSLGCLVLN